VVLVAVRDFALDQDRDESPDPRAVVAVVHPGDFVPDVFHRMVGESAVQAKDRKIKCLCLGWLHGTSEPCQCGGAQESFDK